jgi:hypothetical protein
MTIHANAEMMRVHRELIETGRITRSAYEYAITRGYTDAEILEEVNKVRQSRARLAVQGAPIMYRPDPPPSNPTDPTPEWQRKHGSVIGKEAIGRGEVVPQKRYRIRHVIEQHGDKFDLSHRSALEQFLTDASYAMKIGIADLNRSGGGDGNRLGGLGNVPQDVRDRHARDAWVAQRIAPGLMKTARALVLRELLKKDGTPFTLEEFGGVVLPEVKDRNRRWGISAGQLIALADHLVFLYQQCPIRIRKDHDERRLLGAGE